MTKMMKQNNDHYPHKMHHTDHPQRELYPAKKRINWTVRESTEQAFRKLVKEKYGTDSIYLYGQELDRAMNMYLRRESRALLRDLRQKQIEQ